MAINWHIDAWAPTDGLVFVSQRLQAADPWQQESDPPNTFVIVAPNFEAQPIDRSVAFGAVRRGFQERFSIDGENEFGFKSLDQLISFARRIYSGSGPGTLGGGGIEPPPEMPPDGGVDGNALINEWPGVIVDANDQRGNGSRLLDAISKASNSNPESAVKSFIGANDTACASSFLISCAFEAADTHSFDDAYRLLRTALCFASSPNEFEAALSTTQSRNSRTNNAAFLVRSLHSYHFRELGFSGAYKPNLVRVMHSPIPAKLVRALGLPGKVRTMLDIMSYLAADREYVAGLSNATLLPLLLAIAANFRAQLPSYMWHDDMWNAQSNDQLLRDCSRLIADWLPIHALPQELETEIHGWSLRGPHDQRTYKDQTEIPTNARGQYGA
jgi:hypothetical protein